MTKAPGTASAPACQPCSGRSGADIFDKLPDWTEDSFPGILLNVTAGRVANRFDLGGANYTVDAACGVVAGGRLPGRPRAGADGAADMVVLGGADTVQNPFSYLAFSKTHALLARAGAAGRSMPGPTAS